MVSKQPVAAPVVTVVVTVHDRPAAGARAVRSALAQRDASVEVVVVDDGSASPFVPGGSDPRVRVLRVDRSRGVCAARNAGLATARGEWIAFLDDDDELDPEMVASSLAAVRRSALPGPVAALGGIRAIRRDGPAGVLPGFTAARTGDDGALPPDARPRVLNALLAPTEVLRAAGGWDEDLRAWEHEDLLLRLIRVCSIQGVDAPLYLMSDPDGPRNRERWLDMAEGMRRTMRKHRSHFEAHRDRYAHHLATMGVTYLRAGSWRDSVAATTRAVLLDPRRSVHYVWWAAALMGPRVFERARPVRRALVRNARDIEKEP